MKSYISTYVQIHITIDPDLCKYTYSGSVDPALLRLETAMNIFVLFQDKKCFQLPYTVEEEEELEKCTTKLGPPRCEKTPVSLPKQICVDIQHVPAPAPVNHYAAIQPIQPASLPYLG